ncbi:C40 family peptidase [Ulvibacter litoralis]|uniref:NlpC/P60 family protein n=1 Tax=Ulvibacter litoralis TaxID=227084 RepID=A0A1G7CEJ8_9FLAO|nr:C40 family peptidase [Ulvibacter litoralis]GHC47657.1 hypothetical protein GCM10008083_08630 [Ulvibacter litoralis]SDE37721.1 NlpC/P60 family protein [Ulvibacter litoralis]
MKKLLLLALLAVFFSSCGSSNRVTKTNVNKSEKIINKSISGKLDNIVDYAKTFEGTRYKYGGTTKKGMDCSGLVFTAFGKENIAMPRISRDMAKKGRKINLSQAAEGDLVFFQTNKSRRVINHVGLVVESNRGEVFFIHSTTSKGVIISSLEERYWKSAFVEARRVI